MPRTRNVSRTQWDTANASNASTARNRNENDNGGESEKENAARNASAATRLRTSSRRQVLGPTSTTVLGDAKGSKSSDKKVSKKGKGKPSTVPKRNKLPLQDITAQFLPAPEAANRGPEHQSRSDYEEDVESQRVANVVATLPFAPSPAVYRPTAPAFTSPLPPSSPPSDLPFSPPPKAVGAPSVVSPTHSIPHEEYDPWQDFDNNRPASNDNLSGNDSNSDPFGFVALERKLKIERAHIHSDPDHPEELVGFGHVLVADTSSPRPVRRLKRPIVDEAEADKGTEEVVEPAHFATPPTPHKDKQKRRRLSHEAHNVFSACSSSIESSPSPSKVPARTHSRGVIPEDPLDEFNDKVDRSHEVEVASAQIRLDVDPEVIAMNLRKRERRPSQAGPSRVDHGDMKKPKSAGKAKATKRSVRKPTKKEKVAENESEEEDFDEKWERERQERIKYFRDLEGYKFEKEDVFVV